MASDNKELELDLLDDIGELVLDSSYIDEDALNLDLEPDKNGSWGLDDNLDINLNSSDGLDANLFDDIDVGDLILPADAEQSDNNIKQYDRSEILEIISYLKEESTRYDLMKLAETLNRFQESKKRYEESLSLEENFVKSLNTTQFKKRDYIDFGSVLQAIEMDKSISISRVLELNNFGDYLNNRIFNIIKFITVNWSLNNNSIIDGDAKAYLLAEMNKILLEIKYSIDSSNKENNSQIRFKQSQPVTPESVNKQLENYKVVYCTDKIVEIKNPNLNQDNKRKKYYKVNLTRAFIEDSTLTTEQIEERYPLHISMVFQDQSKNVNMWLYQIKNKSVSAIYEQLCIKKNIEAKDNIIKPFFIRNNDILVVFEKLYMYKDFENNALDIIKNNYVETSGKEWYIGVKMSNSFYSDIYEQEDSSELDNYITYSNDEIYEYIKNYFKNNKSSEIFENILYKTNSTLQRYKTNNKMMFIDILVKYTALHKKNTGKNLGENDIFTLYKQPILLEYIFPALARIKYLVNRFSFNNMYIGDKIDIFLMFSNNGLLKSLKIDQLETEEIINKIKDVVNINNITLESVVYDSMINNYKLREFEKNPGKDIITSYQKAKAMLKIFSDKYSFENIFSIFMGENKNSEIEKKRNDLIMINEENIIDSHKKIIKYFFESLFEIKKIKNEDELINELTEVYISYIKPTEYSNIRDAHIYLRTGFKENKENIEVSDPLLKESLIKLNINRYRDGFAKDNTEDLIELLYSPELNIKYQLDTKVDKELFKNSELLKDINKLINFTETINIVPNIISNVLDNVTNGYIEEYKSGDLFNSAAIPSKELNNFAETQIKLTADNTIPKNYGIRQIFDGINTLKPFTINRDKSFIYGVFNSDIFDTYKEDRPGRFRRLTKNILINSLETNSIELPGEVRSKNLLGYSAESIISAVNNNLDLLCPTELDKNQIMKQIRQSLYYQSSIFVKEEVENELKGYKYYELDENYTKITDLILFSKYITILSGVLGYGISNSYIKDMRIEIERIKSEDMERVSALQNNSLMTNSDKRRSNKLYKAFLKTQDRKILKGVNKDLVDISLLTQEPTADGKNGGEYSRTALIEKYDLNDQLLTPEDSQDLDYFYTVLTIEKYYPDIIDELPKPIVEYMCKPREIEDMFKNDELFKTTKFNLQLV